jgi:hypothetical protein
MLGAESEKKEKMESGMDENGYFKRLLDEKNGHVFDRQSFR